MGSGHILVYAFDVLMQIYESYGYSPRDAAKSIVENNIYGLDIDDRAFQLAYFAIMMKARSYNRRFLTLGIEPNLCAIQESNGVQYAKDMGDLLLSEEHRETLQYLLHTFVDAKEYGSILNVEKRDYDGFLRAWELTAGQTAENVVMLLWYSECDQIVPVLARQAKILSQKYDVAITNPPYMGISNGNVKLNKFVKKNYPDSKSDLFAVFIERCGQMIKENRYQAMITQHAWMFLSSFEKLRVKLQMIDTVNMAHLGARAFEEIGGEVVQTTSFVMRKSHISEYKGTYCRLIQPTTQKGKEEMYLAGEDRYTAVQDNFTKILGSPVAYWVSVHAINAYSRGTLVGDIAFPKTGMTTGDNNRFLRLWYEVQLNKIMFDALSAEEAVRSKRKWFPYCKGGGFKRYYGYNEYVVNWENNGHEIKNNIKSNGSKAASVRSETLYFQKLITWSAVASGKFSCRLCKGGALFDSGGSSISAQDNTTYILALLNSVVGQFYLDISNATINYQPGDVARIPVIIENLHEVDNITQENVKIAKKDWDSFEISWDFVQHPLIRCAPLFMEKMQEDGKDQIKNMDHMVDAYKNWENECLLRFDQLRSNEEELNRIFIDIYGLQDELTPEVEDKNVTVRKADLGRDIRSFISYAVGCMFGRFSLDQEGKGPLECWKVDADNIIPITDEEYFKEDVVSRFVEFVKAVYGEGTLEENLRFIAQALGNKGDSSREVIRNYFLKDFYTDHLKVYQKRPIYWLFHSGKQNGFKALIYMHRYDADTIGNLRVDYLHRMERIYESEIDRMQDMIDNGGNAREVTAASKRKEKLQKQLKECQEYDEKIGHLALSRIEIDLDDGVKVNYEKVQIARDGKKYQVLVKV